MNSIELNTNNRYATFSELDYLRTLASALPATIRVVMIGAGPGVMALAIKEGNPDCALTVIDKDTCEWTQKHLESAGLLRNVVFVNRYSADVGREWTDHINLLIIDGDHSYAGVKADLEAWLPHIAPGGYVFMHDYDAGGTEFADQERYPGVEQALTNCMPYTFNTAAFVGTAVVIQSHPIP